MTSPHALSEQLQRRLNEQLAGVDETITTLWSTPITWRQPTHTVYIPADAVDATTPALWAQQARELLAEVPLADVAKAVGINDAIRDETVRRAQDKLTTQPIEDLRIDFEDGFTQRTVAQEDRSAHESACAVKAVDTLHAFFTQNTADVTPPSFAGVRIKSFSPETRDRGIETLSILLAGLADAGTLEHINPRQLRITLPKVQHHEQVAAFVDVLEFYEKELNLPFPLRFEVQVETPQAIIGRGGAMEAARIIEAAQGRCLSLHYGTYDYSAYLGVDAPEQALTHPVANFAKATLQVAATAVGVEVSDGSTNWIPRGNHEELLAGWINHADIVNYHLRRGIRQGWDLAPSQLPTRHLATIAYFRKDWKTAAQRLSDYITGETSRWMDEPATAKAMAGFLCRAVDCGAVTSEELARFDLNNTALLHSLHTTGRMPR